MSSHPSYIPAELFPYLDNPDPSGMLTTFTITADTPDGRKVVIQYLGTEHIHYLEPNSQAAIQLKTAIGNSVQTFLQNNPDQRVVCLAEMDPRRSNAFSRYKSQKGGSSFDSNSQFARDLPDDIANRHEVLVAARVFGLFNETHSFTSPYGSNFLSTGPVRLPQATMKLAEAPYAELAILAVGAGGFSERQVLLFFGLRDMGQFIASSSRNDPISNNADKKSLDGNLLSLSARLGLTDPLTTDVICDLYKAEFNRELKDDQELTTSLLGSPNDYKFLNELGRYMFDLRDVLSAKNVVSAAATRPTLVLYGRPHAPGHFVNIINELKYQGFKNIKANNRSVDLPKHLTKIDSRAFGEVPDLKINVNVTGNGARTPVFKALKAAVDSGNFVLYSSTRKDLLLMEPVHTDEFSHMIITTDDSNRFHYSTPVVMASDNVDTAITQALAFKRGNGWESCFHKRGSESDAVFYLNDLAINDIRKKDNVAYVYLLPSENFTRGPELWATSKRLVRPVAKVAVTSNDIEHILSKAKVRTVGMLHDASECEGLRSGDGALVAHVSRLPEDTALLEPTLEQKVDFRAGTAPLSMELGSPASSGAQ